MTFYLLSCVIFDAGCLCDPTCEFPFLSVLCRLILWTCLSRWPLPSEAPQQPYFTEYTPEGNSTSTFSKLPIELLLVILSQTPLTSYLSLSSTCKSLRSLFTTPDFANRVMKESIAHGHLRWLSPLDAIPSEVDRANEIFKQWISVYVPEEPPFHLDAQSPTFTSLSLFCVRICVLAFGLDDESGTDLGHG
jgi:hypothetical protein